MYQRFLRKLKSSRTVRDVIRRVNSWAYIGRHIYRGEAGNLRISEALMSGEPQAIGKLGSGETLAIRKYLVTKGKVDAAGRSAYYWQTSANCIVFPASYWMYTRYCRYMLDEVLPEVTLMSVWFNHGEPGIVNRYCPNSGLVDLLALEPYQRETPWWNALAGKRILAISPFCDTICSQHLHLTRIWAETQVMPQFTLDCVRVPYHHSLMAPKHQDWFETLHALETEMSDKCFDIALIGASAYSLPLAVHAKKLGKQGIHLGGALQLFFGICGRRWDHNPDVMRLMNEYWVRPLPEETPDNHLQMENGAYW